MKKKLINVFIILFVILISLLIGFKNPSINAKINFNKNIIEEIQNNNNNILTSIPNSIIINTHDNVIGSISYGDCYLQVKRINCEIGIPYCLEINKDYPSGQNFINIGDTTENIARILACGYPNKTLKELGVNNENDAYFATQIALWSKIEGYDINKFEGSNAKVLNAIKTIYNASENYTANTLKHTVLEFNSNNTTVQQIVLYMENSIEVTPVPNEVKQSQNNSSEISNEFNNLIGK